LDEVVGHEQGRHARVAQDGGELGPAEARVRASSADSSSSSRSAAGRRASRARNGDPLALAAGEGAWAGLGELGDAEAVQQLERPAAAVAAR